MRGYIKGLIFLYFVVGQALAEEKVMHWYIDADFSVHQPAATAIRQGIFTALDEINHTIQGYEVKLISVDHRGNVARSKKNLKQFLNDEKGQLLFGGMHSPPIIKNLKFIHDSEILMLIPWAAGGPVTRYNMSENWLYRLSIDDTNAGFKLVDYAINERQCKRPYLLLENTPWGDSNYKTLTQALQNQSVQFTGVSRFDWNLKRISAKQIVRKILDVQTDCVFLVSNAPEAETMIRAIQKESFEKPLKIISHWGLTGGTFQNRAPHSLRDSVNLSFIQTCFSFNKTGELEPFAQQVFERASRLFPQEIRQREDIAPPTGFIHAYDLTKLLIQAMNQVPLTDDYASNRRLIRNALENLDKPVKGLIKTYHKPFSEPEAPKMDGHEALGLSDYCMGQFNQDNDIVLIE